MPPILPRAISLSLTIMPQEVRTTKHAQSKPPSPRAGGSSAPSMDGPNVARSLRADGADGARRYGEAGAYGRSAAGAEVDNRCGLEAVTVKFKARWALPHS